MFLNIVDRWRNVSIPATGTANNQNLFGLLDGLLVGHNLENKQIYFECDQEFMTALEFQDTADPRRLTAPKDSDCTSAVDGKPPVRYPTYRDVPFVIAGV